MKPTGKNAIENKEAAEVVHSMDEDIVVDFTGVEIEEFYDDIDFDTFVASDIRVVKVKACEEIPKSKKLLKFTLDDGSDTDRIILSGIKEYYTPEELIGKNLVAIVNLPPRAMMGEESNGMILSAVHTQNGEERLRVLEVSHAIPAGAKIQ